MNFLDEAREYGNRAQAKPGSEYALISIAESLNVLAGERISVDELRIALEEMEWELMDAEEFASNLLGRFDIRRKA